VKGGKHEKREEAQAAKKSRRLLNRDERLVFFFVEAGKNIS